MLEECLHLFLFFIQILLLLLHRFVLHFHFVLETLNLALVFVPHHLDLMVQLLDISFKLDLFCVRFFLLLLGLPLVALKIIIDLILPICHFYDQ